MTGNVIIRRASKADAADLAELMGEAFMTDPVSGWVFPEPDVRRKLHPEFFRVFVDLVLAAGVALTTQDLAGVTLWLDVDPANDEEDDPQEFLGQFRPFLDDDHLRRFGFLDGLMRLQHPHAEPHAYLAFAAVHPSRQGQGLGERLLRHHLADVEAAGLPAYVEASSQRNAKLYARVGFGHRQPTLDLPGGPSLYPMWRPLAG